MDEIAINIVGFWNAIVSAVGADTLTMRETAKNGYTLFIGLIALVGGGGFFFVGRLGGDSE
jgi:hypothetical protein